MLNPTPREWGLFPPIFPRFPKSHLSHRKAYKPQEKTANFNFNFGIIWELVFGF